MRIIASNPDTIGDLVLRGPMYRALIDAGHELALVVRPLVLPIVEAMLPGVRTLMCDADPYLPDPDPHAQDLDGITARARELDPDMLVVAPFQWTRLEERLAFALPRAGKAIMTGRRYAHEEWGEVPPSGIVPSVRVEVEETTPELEKNQRLASALLGRKIVLPAPRLEASPSHLAAARDRLRELGLAPGSYWVACVGETRWTALRNWPLLSWSRVLAAWGDARDRRFLLVGNDAESAASLEVISEMGEHASRAASWSGVDASDLGTLVGLLALSQGYVGRDTGPMHLAAALGRPVLAVFGGGTWPRFLPAAERSVALAVEVPCFGCDWRCHLPKSYCVKSVPEGDVLRAIDDLESGRVRSAETRLIEAPRSALAAVGAESARAVRAARVTLTSERRMLTQDRARLESLVRATSDRVDQLVAMLDSRMVEASASGTALSESRVQASALAQQVTELRLELSERDRQLEDAGNSLESARRASEAASAEVRDQSILLERERERAGVLGALSRQLQNDLDGTYAELERVRQRLREAVQQRDALLASRWRRYGQRVGLVMVMPWEREARSQGPGARG